MITGKETFWLLKLASEPGGESSRAWGAALKPSWASPLALRRCFWGSGASWERSGSADSAAAEDGCGTGGGAAQHPHLDPCRRRENTWMQPVDGSAGSPKVIVNLLPHSSSMTQTCFWSLTRPNRRSFQSLLSLTSLCPQPGSEAAAPPAEWGREGGGRTRSPASVCVAGEGLSQGCVCRDKIPHN